MIVVEAESGECLRESKRMRESLKTQGCYIVLLQSSGKVLCSFITDLITEEVQCGECLCETKRMRDSMKTQRCYIVFLQSSGDTLCSFITDLILVKVQCGECLCETKKNERFDEKLGILQCFVVEQWQYVVLLVDRYDCS